MADQRRLTGYRRPDGTVGTRNHVAILPVDDLSNAAAEGVASLIPGTLALPHAFGRLQFGEDLELTFRTLIGVGSNPNVAAVVVIGIEPNWTARVADGIAKTGKPVHAISIEGRGDLKVVEEVSHVAQQFLQDASEVQREPVERSEVLLTMKDGESDTTTGLGSCRVTAYLVDKWVDDGGTVIFGETSELTGGEHLVAERCATDEVRTRFQSLYDDYIDMIEQTGANLLGSQPTQGNIAGGLSTIEEKALGNIVKTGSRPIVGALGAAEAPTSRRPALHGHLVRGRRVRDPDDRRGRRGQHVPDRPGQRDRQPGAAGGQDHREPEDGSLHGRPHGRRLLGRARLHHLGRGGRRAADRHRRAHHQRPDHLRRSARPPRVHPHQALPQRLRAGTGPTTDPSPGRSPHNLILALFT